MPKKPGPKPKKKKPKKAHGRPKYERNDMDLGSVSSLAAFGLGEQKIADHIGIALNTLRKHYGRELKKARTSVMGRAMSGLVVALNKDEPWAIKLVLMTLGKDYGWTERSEHSGPDGGAIPVRLSSLTDAQLVQLLERLQLAFASRAHPGGNLLSHGRGPG